MRTLTLRTALAVCAVASLAAAAVPASAASPTTTASGAERRAAQQPVLVDCARHPQVRPGAFVLACGDGNSRLASLHWSRWDAGAAVGTGVNVVNDCKPYCAAGRFHSYRVEVRLDHPRQWKQKPNPQHYTLLTLTYPDGRPERTARTVTVPLWG
ncbi:hypothetical protein ACL02U_03080 [Streptomyces sp. MS06]|uniref:hypothetical protein n=1 Tax=Streptomyces sp. MS06 TaxID=3385974 RepID=UPI0039A0B563